MTIGVRRIIMARYFTVLIALVAQGMALMSPVCFVRCVAPGGHECVELASQGCHRCDCPLHDLPREVCAGASCCHHHEVEEQAERDAPVEWQVRCEPCACRHSPLDSAPQVQSKSLSSEGQSQSQTSAPALATLDFAALIRALENSSLSVTAGLRPQESPHLTVIATVVLRV